MFGICLCGIKRRSCRLDNLVLDHRSKVLAVLDWELSTLGHPVADLAYSAMPYHLPRSEDGTGLQALPEALPEGTSSLNRTSV